VQLGSLGALKLPQQVWVEPGHQTGFGVQGTWQPFG